MNIKMKTDANNTHKKLILKLILVWASMFAFAIFVLPPMYRIICEWTGANGYTNSSPASLSQTIDETRDVTIEFISNINPDVDWAFEPETFEITTKIGSSEKIFYYAKNNSSEAMTVQAVPSVTPAMAAPYFKKVECFCFTQQRLAANADIEMPVIFYLDTELPEHINKVTLAYTLLPVEDTSNKVSKTSSEIDGTNSSKNLHSGSHAVYTQLGVENEQS